MSKLFGPVMLGAFGSALLVALGVWQVERLEWKKALIADLETQMASPPQNLEEFDFDQNHLNGRPVIASGKLDARYTDILSGSDGAGAGYRRVVAMETDSHLIMVELGFLPESQKSAPFHVPENEVEIQGHIYAPQDGEGSYDATRNIWVGYDLDAMAELLGTSPVILVASQPPLDGLEATPMEIDLPNNHLHYAITWFSLAIVWATMGFSWGLRRAGGKRGDKSEDED